MKGFFPVFAKIKTQDYAGDSYNIFRFRLLYVAFQPVLGCVLACFTLRFRLFRNVFKAPLQPKTGCFVKTYDREVYFSFSVSRCIS